MRRSRLLPPTWLDRAGVSWPSCSSSLGEQRRAARVLDEFSATALPAFGIAKSGRGTGRGVGIGTPPPPPLFGARGSAGPRPQAPAKSLHPPPRTPPLKGVAPSTALRIVPKRSDGGVALQQQTASVRRVAAHNAPENDSNATKVALIDAIGQAIDVSPRVIGVIGGTGSGKSTLVPFAALEAMSRRATGLTGTSSSSGAAPQPHVIWVTQPTRAACAGVAHFAAKAMTDHNAGASVAAAVGHGLVGLALPDGEVHVSATSRVIYTTPGYFTRRFGHATKEEEHQPSGVGAAADKSESPLRCDAVMVDEAHIADAEVTALLAFLRITRPDTLIILSSASLTDARLASLHEYLTADDAREKQLLAVVDMGHHRHTVTRWYADKLPSSLTLSMPPSLLGDLTKVAAPKFLLNQTESTVPSAGAATLTERCAAGLALHLLTDPPTINAPPTYATTVPDPASVLVFVPGFAEMRGVAKQLIKLAAHFEWTTSTAVLARMSDGPAVGTAGAGTTESDVEDTATCDFLTVRTAAGSFVDVLLLHGSAFEAKQRGAMRLILAQISKEYAAARNPKAATGPIAAPRRRIYIATNIAESSLTIPDVRSVIDTGTERREVEGEQGGVAQPRYAVFVASPSSVLQRCGRVGRTFPGFAVHLYSLEAYQASLERQASRPADTARVALDQRVLLLLASLPRCMDVCREQRTPIEHCLLPSDSDRTVTARCAAAVERLAARRWVSVAAPPTLPVSSLAQLQPTYFGRLCCQLSVSLPFANFLAVSAAMGSAVDAIATLAGFVALSEIDGKPESLLERVTSREAAKLELAEGHLSDVWIARNVGCLVLSSAKQKDGRAVRNPRGMSDRAQRLMYALGISLDISELVCDTAKRLAGQLERALRTSEDAAEWAVDIEALRQLGQLASRRGDTIAVTVDDEKLFAATPLAVSRLAASCLAAFSACTAVGIPSAAKDHLPNAEAFRLQRSSYVCRVHVDSDGSKEAVQGLLSGYLRALSMLLPPAVASTHNRLQQLQTSPDGTLVATMVSPPTTVAMLTSRFKEANAAPAVIRGLNVLSQFKTFGMVSYHAAFDAPSPAPCAERGTADSGGEETGDSAEGSVRPDSDAVSFDLRIAGAAEDTARVIEALNGTAVQQRMAAAEAASRERSTVDAAMELALQWGWDEDAQCLGSRLAAAQADAMAPPEDTAAALNVSAEAGAATAQDDADDDVGPTSVQDDSRQDSATAAKADKFATVLWCSAFQPTLRYVWSSSSSGSAEVPSAAADGTSPSAMDDSASAPHFLCPACAVAVPTSERLAHLVTEQHCHQVRRLANAGVAKGALIAQLDRVLEDAGLTTVSFAAADQAETTSVKTASFKRTSVAQRSILAAALPPSEESASLTDRVTPGRAPVMAVVVRGTITSRATYISDAWLFDEENPALDVGLALAGALDPVVAADCLVLTTASQREVRAVWMGGRVWRVGKRRRNQAAFAKQLSDMAQWCVNPSGGSIKQFRRAATLCLMQKDAARNSGPESTGTKVATAQEEDEDLVWTPIRCFGRVDEAARIREEAQRVAVPLDPFFDALQRGVLLQVSRLHVQCRLGTVGWRTMQRDVHQAVARSAAEYASAHHGVTDESAALQNAVAVNANFAVRLGRRLTHALAVKLGYANDADMFVRGLGCGAAQRGEVLLPGALPTTQIPSQAELAFLKQFNQNL